MAKKRAKHDSLKVTYQSTAEARAQAGNIPVFCAFDKLMDPKDVDVTVSRYARITGNVGGICVRDGKEIPYAVLKQEWEKANGLESELR